MVQKKDQSAAHQAADVVDDIAENIRSVGDAVSGTVHDAVHTVRRAAGRAAGAVEDTYDGAGRFARDSVNYGRSQIRSWEDSFEDCIRENPKASLVIAAAVGAFAFAWWRRR